MSLALKIIVGILALAVGVWLGLPGRYDQSVADLERDMAWRTGRTYRVKRHFTPMAWMQRQLKARGDHSRARHSFRMESPDQNDVDNVIDLRRRRDEGNDRGA